MTGKAIVPFARPASGTIRPPGSKSLTNRALVCAALAQGKSLLTGVLDSEDTRIMVESLSKLGLSGGADFAKGEIQLPGWSGHIPASSTELFIGNSGTTMRFLTAMLALGHGTFTLDGTTRMRQRPIQDLLDSLSQLNVKAKSIAANGCPPITIHANGLSGGNTRVRGDISSQFLSGLLMAAPYAKSPIDFALEGDLVSRPYVHMTLAVMREFGIAVPAGDLANFHIDAPRCYVGREYQIEPDASAAGYFWAAAAITGGKVTVEGLNRNSLQGDITFCDCLAEMGCEVAYADAGTTVIGRPLHGIDVDLNSISDTVQTLAAVSLFAEGPTTIRGVGHIRHKETDRIAALTNELRKLGADVDEWPDGLRIAPRRLQAAEIETYDDHRMAMSMTLVGLKQPGIVIKDPDCTAKTYPGYFGDLEKLRG